MADDEKVFIYSLKSIIKNSKFVDENDNLFNAILKNGINGLYEFREEIAPKNFNNLESSVKELLATKSKCIADDERNLRTSLKSIIKEAKFVDEDNNLCNAILKNGINGLYEFREEIAPKYFNTLNSSVMELLSTKNKYMDNVFNEEKAIEDSLRLLIETSEYIDTNDALLNAILKEGLFGLHKFNTNIPPKVFKKLESSVEKLLSCSKKDKYNQETNSHQVSFNNFIVNQLRVMNVPNNLHTYIQKKITDNLSNIIKEYEFCITNQNAYDMLNNSLTLNQMEDVKDIKSFLEILWKPVQMKEKLKLKMLNKLTSSCLEVLKNLEENITIEELKKLKYFINDTPLNKDILENKIKIHSSSYADKISPESHQRDFSEEIVTKLRKQKELLLLMPDCLEKCILKLIFLIRLVILPDNNITHLFKKQEEPINFDDEILSFNKKFFIEGVNFNKKLKENLQRAISLIEMGHLSSALSNLESLFKQIQPIDIRVVMFLVEKAKETFKLIENQDIIFLIGKTGSGKTATIHFFSGSKMVKQQVEIKPGMFLNHITAEKQFSTNLSNFVVSCRAESETRYINPIQINLKDLGAYSDTFVTICDSPGFGDTAGPEVDIANSISIVEGIRCCKSVRPVILMNYEDQGGRGDGIREMTRMIQDMVINVEQHLSSFSYLFTKYQEINIHTSLLNIFMSIEKTSGPNDETFKAILEDMLNKTKKNVKSLDLINHNPLVILKNIIDTPCIEDPKKVFRYTMAEQSKSALYMQAKCNMSTIISAVKSSSYSLIKYKVVELMFLCDTLELNEIKQILNESIGFVITHVNKCFEDTKERLSRYLDNQSKLSFDELEYYVSQVEKFKDLHIFKDVEPLAKISGLSETLIQNMRSNCIKELDNFTSLNIFDDEYSKTSLDNLKIISEKCDNQGYIKACQFVTDQVNMIEENLVICLEKNDFNESANLLQRCKITCIKFNGHENLQVKITSVYKNLQTLVISKLKMLSECCDNLFAHNLNDKDLNDINDCLQVLENTKNTFLCEHFSKEEIDKYYEAFLSKIIQFFEKLNNEVNHLFENRNFREMEDVYKQIQSLRQIRNVDQRTAEVFYSTYQNITGHIKSLSNDTEKLINNINNHAVDYNKVFSNIEILRNAEWLNKHKCGFYNSIIKNIQNGLTERALDLYNKLVEINLNLESYLELEKVDKMLLEIDGLKKFQVNAPDIQKYCDQFIEHLNKSVEQSLIDIVKSFCLEKHSLNHLKKKNAKLFNIKKEYQMLGLNYSYLKSNEFNSLEKVDEKIMDLKNTINDSVKKIAQRNVKLNCYTDILNKYRASENEPKINESKNDLLLNDFISVEDFITKENKNKQKICELKKIVKRSQQQIEHFEKVKLQFNELSSQDLKSNEAIEFISETKYKNIENLNCKIRDLDSKIRDAELIGVKFYFENIDIRKAEAALNYLNSCLSLKLLNKKVTYYKIELENFLCKYKDFVISEMSSCLDQIQALTLAKSSLALRLSHRIKFRLEECIRIENYALLNDIMQCQHIKNDFIDRLTNYHMIIDQFGNNDYLKAEVVKAFTQLDKYSANFKFNQLFCDYKINKMKELNDFEKSIIDCIENCKFNEVAIKLVEIDEKDLKDNTMNKIKINLASSINKIINETRELLTVLKDTLDKNEIIVVIKQLTVLNLAKKCLYNDRSLQEKFKVNSYVDEDTQKELTNCFKFIEDTVSKKLISYIKRVNFYINQKNFYEAEVKIENLSQISTLLEKYYNSIELNNKIVDMRENLEERLNMVTETYANMSINDYSQKNGPKEIIEELEKLVDHTSNEKYLELLSKIKISIETQLKDYFRSVKDAKPNERAKCMKLIKSTLCFLPNDIKKWVNTEFKILQTNVDKEIKIYHDEFNKIKNASDINTISNFIDKCKRYNMEEYIGKTQSLVFEQVCEYNRNLTKSLEANDICQALQIFTKCLEFMQVFDENFDEIKKICLSIERCLVNKFNNICSNFLSISINRDIEYVLSCFYNLNCFSDLRAVIEMQIHSNSQCLINFRTLVNTILIGLEKSYEKILDFFLDYQEKFQSALEELNTAKINETMTVCQNWNSLLSKAIEYFKINAENSKNQKVLLKIEFCILYDEMKNILTKKLQTYKDSIHDIEHLNANSNERELLYQTFVKRIFFLFRSKDLKSHIKSNVFDPNLCENEVSSYLTTYFDNLYMSTKKLFCEDSDNTLQDFDFFRLNIDKMKLFEMQSKLFGINFNLSIKVQKITKKMKKKLNYFYSMVEKSEGDVNKKALWLIKIKTFANYLPEYSDDINKKLDEMLKIYSKKHRNFHIMELVNLRIALEQDRSGVGFNIISEHSVFKGELISIFNQNTRFHGINYVLSNITGDDINVESIQRLKDLFDFYSSTYQEILKSYITRINEKDVLNELVRSIKQNGEKVAKNFFEKKKWDEYDKKIISILIASIFVFWTLKNVEYYNQMEGTENKESYLLTPHPSQVISIFRILGFGYMEIKQGKTLTEKTINAVKTALLIEKTYVISDKLQNNLVQIETGEGKSLVLAVVSCILTLIGFDVRCACYSEYLSSRDYESFLPLFSSLNLTSHIRYATFNTVCEDVINQNFNIRNRVADLITNKPVNNISSHKKKSQPMILLIDEVDVFFNKDFYGKSYTPLALIKHSSIFDLTSYIWSHRKEKLTLKDIEKTPEYEACCNYFKDWNCLITEAVIDMLSDVENYKHDYIVKNDKLAYKEQDGISYDVVYGYKTLFAYYFEHDEGRISTESLKEVVSIGIRCGNFSFAEIPHNFCYIMGVSGTLKTSDSEKKIVESYAIKKFSYIPSIFGENRRSFAKEADIFIENNEDYFVKLSEHIKHSATSKEFKRPVLVFFNTNSSLAEFYNSNKMTLNKDNIQIITEEVSESPKKKEMLVKRATTSGQVTFLTSAFGRGTDFVCNDQNVIDNGGVHVIQTFFSEKLSEEIQIQGRTARQGKDGSYSMVLLDRDLEKYLGIDYKNKIDKFRNERSFYQNLNLERNKLFESTYLNIQKLVSEAKKEHIISQIFVENLNDCEIDKIKTFLRDRNLGSALDCNVSRTVCLMDATGSMTQLLSKAKAAVGTMFERASSILIDHCIPANSFQMQFAVYRNYNCNSDKLLEFSVWETKADNLKTFMNNISANGGLGAEAIEIGLWHVNRENKENIVNQIILIGDAPANSLEQIKINRKIYGEDYWKTTDFKTSTFYETELKELINNKIVVHAFYLHDRAQSNFQKISSETGGECRLLNIDSTEGVDVLTDIVTQQILRNVGQIRGKGIELVKAYNTRYSMRQTVNE